MSERISDIPEQDRPREKLLRKGAAALSDQELLAVLLGKGTPLFHGIEGRQKLRLTRTTQLGKNVVVLCYEPIAS